MKSQNEELKELLERLYARQNFGIKMGLDVERELLRRIGNPEKTYGAIHVAGTNGKGSVCAILDSILRVAGYKVGLYTSPHLVRFNERIQVDGTEITDEELGALFKKTEPLVSAVMAEMGREPTFFECTTAMALDYFRSRGIELAVLETGMGGRLDATNVVTPLVSVITRISVEHTAYLGKDIEAIAAEKCGIIKTGRPVVCGSTDENVLDVVRRTAREKGSLLIEAAGNVSLRVVSRDWTGQKIAVETGSASYGTVKLPLIGKHQVENLAIVVAVVEVLNDVAGLDISPGDVKAGVSNVSWPGRFQVLSVDPPVVLDGAHNPGAGEALADTLREMCAGKPVGFVLGMCSDKDVKDFLKSFTGLAKKLWAVPLQTERSMAPALVRAAADAMGWDSKETTVQSALAEAEDWARSSGGVVCICGSLFLVGEVLAIRGVK